MQVYVLEFCTGACNTHVFSSFFKAEEGLAQACKLLDVPMPQLNSVYSWDGVWCYCDPADYYHGAISSIYITRHDLDQVITQTN